MTEAQLRAFCCVMQEGSVSAAAQTLFLSQPAVTKRLQALEGVLGVKLFDHIGRKVVPTPAALKLLPDARRWLAEFSLLKHELKTPELSLQGTITLGTSHHFGLHHLAPVLVAWQHEHAEVELDVRFVDSEEAHRAVHSGLLPMAFMTLPSDAEQRREPDCSYQELVADPLYFVAARDHALAGKPVDLQLLSETKALLPDGHTYTTRLVLEAFARERIRLSLANSGNTLESIRALVGAGLGWSVLPQILIDESLVKLDLTQDPKLSRSLGIMRHTQRTLSLLDQRFYEFVTQHFSQMPTLADS